MSLNPRHYVGAECQLTIGPLYSGAAYYTTPYESTNVV